MGCIRGVGWSERSGKGLVVEWWARDRMQECVITKSTKSGLIEYIDKEGRSRGPTCFAI